MGIKAVFTCLLSAVSLIAAAKEADMKLSAGKSGNVIVSRDGNKVEFGTDFLLVYREDNPGLELKNITECRYFVPVWNAEGIPEQKIFKQKVYGAEHGGDGIDESMQKVNALAQTGDYFYAGQRVEFKVKSSKSRKDTLFVSLVAEGYGNLDVSIYDDGMPYPVVEYDFEALRKGYFSVVYTGAPQYRPEEVAEIWQPMVWQQKRFPQNSYLTMAFQCSLPATLVSVGNCSYGVMADSSELPFQPLPTRENNNRFGVILRNAEDNAQPMIAAPVLGGEGSRMEKGNRFSMKMRLVVSSGTIPQTYSELAVKAFGFKDYRKNEISSVNRIIDRMVDYTLSPYSNFIDSLKGCSYSTDVPGSTKNVSSLHPLSIALVTDNDSLFRNRAIPIMEYMLSRDNFLFCLDTSQKVQNPSRKLGKPCASASELITLYYLTGKNCDFLKVWAENKFYRNKPVSERQNGRGLWNDALAMYKSSGDAAYLDWAVRGADRYLSTEVDRIQTGFKSGFFWNSFVPKYIHLLDMYETTGEGRYLDSAHKAARYYAMFTWMCPAIPDDSIRVNIGNKAPWYWYLKSRGIPQQYAPEETVEAWRLSEIGLVSESPTTGIGHRAVFMAHHAPYFLSIAHYTGDTFLRDIARSAIVGRYRNFPGYHINTMRNTAYEQEDFPYHRHDEISATSFHYNHPFPHISILIDYLVTDAFDKSGEKISFPSKHIEGYGYLQNRFYGCDPGVFYSEKNVWLWMPSGLVSPDNVELNYLAARSDNSLCIAFMNQCGEAVKSGFSIDTGRVPDLKDRTVEAELWSADRKLGNVVVRNGQAEIAVPAKGISSVIIRNCKTGTAFQEKFQTKGEKWKNSFYESDFGHMSACLLDMGENLKEAYVFMRDDDSVFSEVSLQYSIDGGEWITADDNSYPYEFSFSLPEDTGRIVMRVSALDKEGKRMAGEEFMFSRY